MPFKECDSFKLGSELSQYKSSNMKSRINTFGSRVVFYDAINEQIQLLIYMFSNLFWRAIFHTFYTANILFQFYTWHLSSYVASSEQFLVVLVVQVITLELSILSIDLPMEGMLQSQVVATSTWPGSLVRWGFYFVMAFAFASIWLVVLLLVCLWSI